MLPEKDRPEWRSLIKGKIDHNCSSFSLQMKINSLQRIYKMGLMKIDEAVDDLYSLCEKYENLYSDDIKQIFNS